jgi:subtilisin family serine protease
MAHSARVSEQQDRMSRRIAPLIDRELGRLRVAVNGIKVLATSDNAQRLRESKGVRRVSRIAHHDADNAVSVEWIQAPAVWQSLGDASDMTIAIIDTGIDYLHANFGGGGDPDEYAANDKNEIEPGSFPTAKVIGGWDFAGPTYNSRVDDLPQPDPDPLDGNGHGSHVGGTAAGIGVPGRIGPGVAKGAKILALKVFSDQGGSTDLTADAIDYALDPNGDGAIDDRVDVINMSLGARYGDPNDPSALASTTAVNNGVIVVASAGNNGDNPYVAGSPGVSPEVITVGATIAGGRPQIALRVISDDPELAGLYPAQEGSGAVRIVDAPVTAPLAVARSPTVDDDDNVVDGELDDRACRDLANAADVADKVVLVARGGCTYETKYANVQQAGARAIVVYNASGSGEPFVMGGIGISGKEFAIPGLMISSADAARLRAAIGVADFAVDIAPTNTVPGPPQLADQLTGFTSRGPAHGGAGFKPDLSAPGRYTQSTAAGTGFRARQLRGTSMAAPHVAGAAALLRQRFRTLPVAGIKALLQNATVTSEINGPDTDSPAPLTRQGVGVLRVADAVALTSYVTPAGVSFGYGNVREDRQQAVSVQLVNLSDEARVYTVTHSPRAALPGASVTCPDTVSVEARASASFSVELSVHAAQLPPDNGNLSHAELDGWCVLSDGNDTLRMGYVAALDPASALSAVSDGSSVTLTNEGVGEGRASGFRLAGTGGTRDATRTIAAVGYRYGTLFGFPVFQLALALNQPWEAPAHVSMEMFIDAHGDGIYERVLWASDWSRLGFDPGTYITGVYDVIDNERPNFDAGYTDWFSEYVDFNDQVLVVPFSDSPQYGQAFLKPNERRFDYKLRVTSRDGSFDEQLGSIDLDAAQVTDEADAWVGAGQQVTLELANDRPSLWLMPQNPVGEQFAIDGPLRR